MKAMKTFSKKRGRNRVRPLQFSLISKASMHTGCSAKTADMCRRNTEPAAMALKPVPENCCPKKSEVYG